MAESRGIPGPRGQTLGGKGCCGPWLGSLRPQECYLIQFLLPLVPFILGLLQVDLVVGWVSGAKRYPKSPRPRLGGTKHCSKPGTWDQGVLGTVQTPLTFSCLRARSASKSCWWVRKLPLVRPRFYRGQERPQTNASQFHLPVPCTSSQFPCP